MHPGAGSILPVVEVRLVLRLLERELVVVAASSSSSGLQVSEVSGAAGVERDSSDTAVHAVVLRAAERV